MAGIIIAVLSSTVLATLINQFFEWRKYKRDENSEIRQGLKLLMLDRIRYIGKCHIKEGQIDSEDRRSLNEMHECYQRLGGNGDLDSIMEKVNDLPLDL